MLQSLTSSVGATLSHVLKINWAFCTCWCLSLQLYRKEIIKNWFWLLSERVSGHHCLLRVSLAAESIAYVWYRVMGVVFYVMWYVCSYDLVPVPLSIFRSNLKFDENSERSSFEYTRPITTIFCKRHDSDTVVTCAKYRCDRPRIFFARVFWIFIEFRIRSKYA